MLAAHRAGGEFAFSLWRAFVVERWLRLFMDPARLRPATASAPRVAAQGHVVRPAE